MALFLLMLAYHCNRIQNFAGKRSSIIFFCSALTLANFAHVTDLYN